MRSENELFLDMSVNLTNNVQIEPVENGEIEPIDTIHLDIFKAKMA